jgi:hypothetical protein
MSTQIQRRQQFIRYYKQKTGKKEVDMHEVAKLAHQMGMPLPKPVDPMDLLARQFSEAARQETRIDKETKRPYKANLAITRRLANGKQMAFWFDVDDSAPRHRMVKGLTLYREQMVDEAVIGTNTADHWSRLNPDQQPLEFTTDLTDDVKWRLNAPEENGGAA